MATPSSSYTVTTGTTNTTTAVDFWASSVNSVTRTDSSTDDVWKRWVIPEPIAIELGSSDSISSVRETPTRMETHEEWEERTRPERERAHAEGHARLVEEAKEREEIRARSKDLLVSVLDEEQRQELEEHNYFHVFSQGRRFRIGEGRNYNIQEVDENGHQILRICCRVQAQVPNYDNMAVQKLWLENYLEEFLQMANIQ